MPPTTPNTGEIIGADIAAADAVLTPFIKSFNPAVGAGVSLGLKLLSVAEPAVYNAVVAELQGTPLNDAQKQEYAAGVARLQHPDDYFADPPPAAA